MIADFLGVAEAWARKHPYLAALIALAVAIVCVGPLFNIALLILLLVNAGLEIARLIRRGGGKKP